MAVDDIVTVVLKDRAMYNKSGGGLTLSGGEPTMQPEFSLALLRACREEGLHTAIETCGQTKWERLRELLHYTDYLFYDIKTLDSEKHRKGAGTGNERILENARKAAQIETLHMHVRSPMIPGYNDSKEDVTTIARFVTEELGLRSDRYTILRYNKYAEGKFSRLGRTAEQIHLEPQPVEYIESLNDIIRSF
jgi:pyruvate formate lyase activating enzyme